MSGLEGLDAEGLGWAAKKLAARFFFPKGLGPSEDEPSWTEDRADNAGRKILRLFLRRLSDMLSCSRFCLRLPARSILVSERFDPAVKALK